MMSLKIEIPIHDEEGWTFPSPSEMPVRARLEASATCSPTSPEKLEKLKRAEDYACLLRQAHLEGVQARAARESQRAKEAQARRLRLEATSRQRLQDRLDAVAQREARISTEKAKALSERVAKREMLQEAVKEAREARDQARQERAALELCRCAEASAKREKAIQATIDKNAYQVKHALAVRTALREIEREAASAAAAKTSAKLESADERRHNALHSPREEASERASERAKQVALQQHERLIKTEERRRQLARAMERAEEKRHTMVAEVVAAASARNAQAADAALEAKKANEAEACSVKRRLFGKLNEAEVRRSLGSRRAQSAGELIEVDVRPDPLPSPPAGLVERLNGKARKEGDELAAELAARHVAAQTRAADARSQLAKKATRALKRVGRAAARRSAARDAMVAKMQRRAEAAKHLVADARRAKLEFVHKTESRVKAAAVRRSSARASAMRALARAELKRRAAAGKRAAALLLVSRPTHRVAAAAAKRASLALAREQRGAALAARASRATFARAAVLLRISSAAHLRAVPLTAAAKLTKNGGVLLKSQPATPEPVEDAAKEQATAKEQPVFHEAEEWQVVNAEK